MRIAVYAIAKNEALHVGRWAECAADADVRLIVDTGSTDATVELAEAAGIEVHQRIVDPWRFDTARNHALNLLPDDVDYCINLDLDEVLHEGWRAELERLDPQRITRPEYTYIFSRNQDGSEGFTYTGHTIHARHGYEWRGAIHEYVTRLEDASMETRAWCGVVIEHEPDTLKSRTQYLDLLAEAARAEPESDRYAFYYARELFYRAEYAAAAVEFKRHLGLARAVWRPERAAAMRMLAVCESDQAESWLLRACAEASERREPWVDLAQHYYQTENWHGVYYAATRALAITERPLEYFCEAYAWHATPHDLAALAAYHIGLYQQARNHGSRALALDETDERLRTNMDWYSARAEATT